MQRILEDLPVFVAMTEAINSDLDLVRVLQAVTEAGTQLSGAACGAFFDRPGVEQCGASVPFAPVLSGDGAVTFEHLPSDVVEEVFGPAFAGLGSVRVDDVRTDTRLQDVAADQLPLRSCLGTPVVARSGEVIGALLFGHPEPGRFDERSTRVVRLVATQAAVAIENARLYAAEQQARLGAERAAQRLVLLQEITSRVARSSTRSEVVRAVIETVAGPLEASRVGVFLREGDQLRAVDRFGPDAGRPRPQPPQVRVIDIDDDGPVARCARSGEPVLLATYADLVAQHPSYAGRVDGIETALLLPLVVGDSTLGVLGLAWSEAREVAPLEVEWLSSATEQLSLALRQVALLESERAAQHALRANAAHAISVSRTLQRSLLPPALPEVTDLLVAVRYEPGSEDAEVGGDWYDVIATPDGSVVLVIGDVQGHSIGAAAVMGQLRVALNAYLVEGHQPEAAMSRVNRVMETLRTEVIATCCLVRIDPATGRSTIVRAGHTLPMLCRADGRIEEVDGDAGIPLGVLPEWEWTSVVLDLQAGDRLLLYTDGLVEVPGEDVGVGVEELARAVARTTPALAQGGRGRPLPESRPERQALLEDDVDEVLRQMGPRTRDDVAVLACEYAGPAFDVRRATLAVHSVAQSSAARAFVRTTLRSWGLSRIEDSVTLLVTEMVTNALVHTDGSARLELRHQDGAVRVMVSDSFSRVPQHRPPDPGSTGGRGLLVVGALSLAWGVEPSGEGKTVWADVKA
ncbi:MAG: prpC7 [Marmoricola sp.]|nr:prpC7 [Marmoricola sp.]